MDGTQALMAAVNRTIGAHYEIQHIQHVIDELAQEGYYVAPISGPSSPGVRNTDPRTSKAAAVRTQMRAGTQRHKLLQAFEDEANRLSDRALNEAGLTDEEAMERAEGVLHNSEYATRCSELRGAGFIQDTGFDRTGGSGTPRIVCRITDKGRAELRRLA